ncbi:MAG TPA: winged helix DNA-binding domain-containing protein [Cellulomonas sp.]
MSTGGVVTRRGLGRALLARQHLLEPRATTVPAEVDHLVGLQSQNPFSAYLALHARVRGFRHADLADALLDRRVGRLALVRDTVHLVSAQDALTLWPLLAPLLRRRLLSGISASATLRQVDLDDLARHARDALAGEPLTAPQLGARLAVHLPGHDPGHLALGARGLLPLVQVTPRGVWGRSLTTTWTTADAWFGAPVTPIDPDDLDRARDELVLRYLAAFGPATVADVQRWSGLTRLAAVVDRLRPRLVELRPATEDAPVRAGRGALLLDLPDAPRPADGTPAPVRFLPDFDEVLLGHDDRSRIVPPGLQAELSGRNGMPPGTVLVDGTVAGSWTLVRERTARADGGRGRLTLGRLVVTPLRRWDRAERAAVQQEGEGVVRFLADEADAHAVQVLDGPA